MTGIIDSHAHYDDKRFDGDRDGVLTSLAANGVELVVNIGADMKSSRASIELAERYPFIYATVGVHPHEAASMSDSDFEILREWAAHPKVVAIGEIGLDFYYDSSPRDVQRSRFRQQLELASEVDLPVVIHSRDACAETYDIIKESGVRRGVIHAFSYSREVALAYEKLGYVLGIGGVITFSNARHLVEAVEALPLERLLLETDCPYLSPVPYRGNRNESKYLTYVAARIAEIKNITALEVCRASRENTLGLFKKICAYS